MAKLVKVDVKVPELIPPGSPVEVVYPTTYWATARAAGGMFEGKVTDAVVDGWRSITNRYGNSLMVYGGEIGDPVPPLVQIRVKPRGAGIKGIDWHLEGHPRDTGGGMWDGSKIGQGNSGQTIVTEAQRASLEAAAVEARAAADTALRRAENLGGIRQIAVTDTYVELYDASESGKLTPSTHTTPNGYVLETITIEGV